MDHKDIDVCKDFLATSMRDYGSPDMVLFWEKDFEIFKKYVETQDAEFKDWLRNTKIALDIKEDDETT